MKAAKVLIVLLAVSVFAVSQSSQQESGQQIAENFFPVTPARATRAVQLPLADKPLTHKFFDGQQMLALYAHSGMRVVDTVKTCRELSHGGREDWIPTQSCAGITAWQAGSVGLALGVGWLFHKTGHHRLERVTPWVGTSASAAGWTKSIFNIR